MCRKLRELYRTILIEPLAVNCGREGRPNAEPRFNLRAMLLHAMNDWHEVIEGSG